MIKCKGLRTVRNIADFCNDNNVTKNNILFVTKGENYYYLLYDDGQ